MLLHLVGVCGPSDFQAAADGVSTKTFAKFILPPEALVLNVGTFWFGAHVVSGNGSAVGLAEGMPAGNQCDGFFVVHGHALERFANVPARRDGIGLSVGPFRVHVNQTHLNRSQRIRKITIAAVALVRQPRAFGTPVDVLFGLPHIRASAAETKCLESHRLESDVAGENHQVSPGNFAAVFLLDRPQQPARLVEVHVVGPAIERSEALLPGSGAAAAIADAVRACTVPRHADEQPSVVPEVGRPPILRVGHERMQVFDHGIQIKTLEFLGVVELLTHRIGQVRVLVQDLQVHLIRPPVAVGGSGGSVVERALGFG